MEDTKEITSDVWRTVHAMLGMTIYWDIQKIKKKLVNDTSINKKMESMADSLIKRVIKNPKMDMSDENFISLYNENPQIYRKTIIDEYTREYKEKFHSLYDFYEELNSHKNNINNILNRLQNRKGKTKEDYDAIDDIKNYLKSIIN